jgi:hypothetical protein
LPDFDNTGTTLPLGERIMWSLDRLTDNHAHSYFTISGRNRAISLLNRNVVYLEVRQSGQKKKKKEKRTSSEKILQLRVRQHSIRFLGSVNVKSLEKIKFL